MKNKVMGWVNKLPNVEGTFVEVKRNEISDLVAQADELTTRAGQLREQAYFKSLKLEAEIRTHWSYQDVEKAKALT
ncbi:stable inheritance protein KleA [Salmonella enterica]|uniref:stable inheritance protein KleA n=1 Tax=Klebsiella TaxID=570 RepID=UPI000DA9D91F|nr:MULTISPECIES: stable inheritance protein KleA [Klebsiella]EAR3059030.1 protein kleA [Salmonella enterica]EDF2276396.1 protein kleA [Salmonella enterica subsp. enterica serovar Enteritidis]EDV1001567.1 protein kleA [Salmonella enterica subsp. enterica]EJZ2310424.1 stable inheritance protein KleA [Escherichia coli]ECS0375468.1 protein kleA [Salmonella enterica]